ncbi:MAG TPA: ABC transporter substrate-binding protein [Pseudonocardiaceae bacterium]|jgi:peptide/nickel transport system substrate-binding protein|nr:ABC transporter substrate-binding protein [Pseudonocardiaceae bacterium]
MKRKILAGAAVAAAVLSVLTACGSGSGSSGASSAFNAGVAGVVNASNATGGTLNYALSSAGDSIDPGNTYYAFSWNFSRLYASPLLSYKPAPGAAGKDLVPSLATGLGTVSDNGLTWTYHIKSGMKFSDGEAITTADVKYAIERSTFAKDVLPNGPSYFKTYLVGGDTYQGPYKDKDPNGLASIQTPDATTIVFHLTQPFYDFNYLVADPQTAPVPADKDTGSNYQSTLVSSGPYMLKPGSFSPSSGYTLVKNPDWKQSDNPYDKQLVNQINVSFNVNADQIDSRLISGQVDVDMAGTGVQTAARNKILSNPADKKDSDAAPSGFLWYYPIDTQVIPNVDCRKAIEYAANKTLFQNAYGGQAAGGSIASTVLPQSVIGYQAFDDYEATTQPGGDIAKAKQELAACGKPNGFSFNIAARSDRPKEVASAQALQQALSQVGIKTDILQYPASTYTNTELGSPSFMTQNNIGMGTYGWAADWPEGFGFLYSIADGAAIQPAGNANISMVNDPQINQLLTTAGSTADTTTRNGIYAQIDKLMMGQADVLPELYATSLLYRPSNLSNVYVTQAFGMYDYTQLGLSSS